MDYLELSTTQKSGIFLIIFALMFLWMGIMFFFDQGLLSVGNIGLFVGMIMTVGPKKMVQLFSHGDRIGTMFFFSGFFLVLFGGWAWLGITLQVIGFVLIFRKLFPLILSCARCVPILGPLLSLPFVGGFLDRIFGTLHKDT
eukprot:TRINITY_DN4581_c0_g2_i11.p1 TRINITY_DN4581_c0_g2~~TRINITY_DN4581_c0_g2_i11.p1  ORF type:complete len:159 (-),score=24.54 TRINITY_DN4581_c0_g2_i11:612-1037(-)